MRGFIRSILLSLMLIVVLCIPGYSWNASAMSLEASAFTDENHHQSDEDTRNPACAAVRCECHACPHVSPFDEGASSGPPEWRVCGQWANETRSGVGLGVEIPPPRYANVENK